MKVNLKVIHVISVVKGWLLCWFCISISKWALDVLIKKIINQQWKNWIPQICVTFVENAFFQLTTLTLSDFLKFNQNRCLHMSSTAFPCNCHKYFPFWHVQWGMENYKISTKKTPNLIRWRFNY